MEYNPIEYTRTAKVRLRDYKIPAIGRQASTLDILKNFQQFHVDHVALARKSLQDS